MLVIHTWYSWVGSSEAPKLLTLVLLKVLLAVAFNLFFSFQTVSLHFARRMLQVTSAPLWRQTTCTLQTEPPAGHCNKLVAQQLVFCLFFFAVVNLLSIQCVHEILEYRLLLKHCSAWCRCSWGM